MESNQIYMIMSIEYGYLGELTIKEDGMSLFLLRHIESYKYPSYLGLLARKGQYFFETEEVLNWINKRIGKVLADESLVKKYDLAGLDAMSVFLKLKGESTLDDIYVTPKLSSSPINGKTRARR